MSVSNKDIPKDFEMFGEVWKFYKKYYYPPNSNDEEAWEIIMNDCHNISEKYNTKLCASLLIGIVEEFERKSKCNIKGPAPKG